MKIKNFLRLFLVCAVTVGCLVLPAEAHSEEVIRLTELDCILLTAYETEASDSSGVSRATGSIRITVPAKNTTASIQSYSLDAGETVNINCTYTPASASMNFGLIATNGSFHYINVNNGSINKTIQVDERGTYTLAIMNNSSYTVSVTGTVRY